MKKYLTIIAFLSMIGLANGQSASEVGKIALSVIMPESMDQIDAAQLGKLETKITHLVSETGIAASGYNNNFVLYPKLSIYEVNTVEGGMENIVVVTGELSLFIQQVDNKLIFSSFSKSLKGIGKTIPAAVTNAISKLSANDIAFNSFIETGKRKVIQYYETRCADIIAQSRNLVKKEAFEQAIGLLMTVPQEVGCYDQVESESIAAYKAYQDHWCQQQIHSAQMEMAANRYNSALGILARVDPGASCFADAQRLAKEVGSKVDTEEKKQWDLKMKLYSDAVELEKLRISAAKEVAAAYYKSKPTTVTYTYLVR